MKFYLKMALLPFVYLLFTAMIGLGVMLLEDDLMWLQIALSATNTIFYGIIVSVAGYKDGQKALRVREQNDTFRKRIVQTGEDIPLNVIEEYTPWKGFFIGFLSCVPVLILLAIHFISNIGQAVPDNTVGMIAGIISMVVFGYMFCFKSIAFGQYAISFLVVPLVCGLYGGFYLLGAKKERAGYDEIRRIKREIHGDQN